MKECIFRTRFGKTVDLLDLNPKDIDIRDIAHALSNTCRYNGHTNRFYSVAEHCILLSQCVPEYLKFAALMHDADEAYLGDVVGPFKKLLMVESNKHIGQIGFDFISDLALRRIWKRFDINPFVPIMDSDSPVPFKVRQADLRIRVNEDRDLCGGRMKIEGEPLDLVISSLSMKQESMYSLFLSKFDEYKDL